MSLGGGQMKLDKVLIANRGEIALRIQRACRQLDLRSVIVHSEADRDAAYVRAADEAVCIGPASASHSYLDQAAILMAAASSGADAIHPGYGFLSENAQFAARVEAAGLIFIGPDPATIGMMGDKIAAKHAMRQAGIPCVPGTEGALPDDPAEIRRLACEVGYPLLLKAVGGAGGRGMRVVASEAELDGAVALTIAEVRSAFGTPGIYLERYLDRPHHVEVQILGDHAGNVVWLGERDCSVQRRHQKIIEESPAPGLARDAVAAIGERCREACRRIGYRGAGTFEFLVQDGAFAFIEMNTRLQVEHPVTEMTTGIDIVAAQLRIARGETLSLAQADIAPRGHAIECRVNAEDPDAFTPSPGIITEWRPPSGPGIRVDSHLVSGCSVPPHYDSLIAKIIAWGADRDEAIARMRTALDETRIVGIRSNLALHRALLVDPEFVAGGVDTNFLARRLAARRTG